MGERPILMHARSVRAIQAGRKTQTRRPTSLRGTVEAGDVLWVRETWRELPLGQVAYRADVDEAEARKHRWRPSIFMPKLASRLWLKVTEVRVEHLHDISYDDILAEGLRCSAHGESKCACLAYVWSDAWDSIYAKRAPFASDPEVRVITFEEVPRWPSRASDWTQECLGFIAEDGR